jgi:quercetin dioxygenase-like cupin family protein
MQALGEPVAVLFGTDDHGPVVRADERELLRSHGVADYRVTPSSAARLEVLETHVESGEGSGKHPYSHPGDEECIVILDGVLTVWLGSTDYRLADGDAITFACRTPHRWVNDSGRPTRALWIITPASY